MKTIILQRGGAPWRIDTRDESIINTRTGKRLGFDELLFADLEAVLNTVYRDSMTYKLSVTFITILCIIGVVIVGRQVMLWLQ